MSVRLAISSDANETGGLLKEILIHKGIYDKHSKNLVCYGTDEEKRNVTSSLNLQCRSSKIKRMEAMAAAGCSLVPWFKGTDLPDDIKFPLLARKNFGYGGKDIQVVFQPEEIPWRVAAGWDWFSSYVPVDAEYRVWVFRDEVLDTYTKVMERPTEYAYVGRNFRNGFEFKHIETPKDAKDEAIWAVKALGLDFAAVDMLRGKDGKLYILEANTAPGVLRSKAQATLHKLADRIELWNAQGHK